MDSFIMREKMMKLFAWGVGRAAWAKETARNSAPSYLMSPEESSCHVIFGATQPRQGVSYSLVSSSIQWEALHKLD